MLKALIMIIVSFFALIGIIESVTVILESVAVSRYSDLPVGIKVTLKGKIDDPEFLLNTLSMQAKRLGFDDPKVYVCDDGCDFETYSKIHTLSETEHDIILE